MKGATGSRQYTNRLSCVSELVSGLRKKPTKKVLIVERQTFRMAA